MAFSEQPTTLGTAKWADPDIFSERNRYEEGHIWVGRSPVTGHALGNNDDKHICLVGGSRGGKGTAFIIPNICTWPGSIVVVDPKGENANITAARRGHGSEYCEGLNQKVYVLDPFEEAKEVEEQYRATFNPLDALDPSSPEVIDQAGLIADALVIVKDDSKEPFWEEAARLMLKTIILHVITWEGFEGKRNLITVRELLTRGDREGIKILEEIKYEQKMPTPHQLLWKTITNNQALDGVISGGGEIIFSMMGKDSKTYDGVLQTANINTEFLDSPGIRKCISSSDFRIADLKTDPQGVSLFLSLPQRFMNTHHRWLRMMTSLIVNEMEIVKERPAKGHSVLMILDEFAGLKYMPVIENAISQIAGFDVKLFVVLQSLEQLKATYEKRWQTFLTNTGLKIFIDIDDEFTGSHLSKVLGETEVLKETASTNITVTENESETFTRSESETKSENTSRSVAHLSSETIGDSEGYSEGTSESYTKGQSRSKTKGSNRSKARSFNFGFNRSQSRGHNRSENRGWNESHGINWGSSVSGNQSSGHSRGSSLGSSEQHGSGSNESSGRTQTLGMSRSFTISENTSQTFGLNKSKNSTKTRSQTTGLTITDTEGKGSSKTTGATEAKTTGGSIAESEGTGQTFHKRPLITPDELRLTLARIKDRDHHLYPGYALVVLSGQDATAVQRCLYYEDEYFIGRFDPHPKHPESAPPKFIVELELDGIAAYEKNGRDYPSEFADYLPLNDRLAISNWQVETGQEVEQFQLLASVGDFKYNSNEYIESAIAKIECKDIEYYRNQDSFRWNIYSRFSGKIKRKSSPDLITSVGVLETNQRRLHFESEGRILGNPTDILSDYLKELQSTAKNLELDEIRRLKEEADRKKNEQAARQAALEREKKEKERKRLEEKAFLLELERLNEEEKLVEERKKRQRKLLALAASMAIALLAVGFIVSAIINRSKIAAENLKTYYEPWNATFLDYIYYAPDDSNYIEISQKALSKYVTGGYFSNNNNESYNNRSYRLALLEKANRDKMLITYRPYEKQSESKIISIPKMNPVLIFHGTANHEQTIFTLLKNYYENSKDSTKPPTGLYELDGLIYASNSLAFRALPGIDTTEKRSKFHHNQIMSDSLKPETVTLEVGKPLRPKVKINEIPVPKLSAFAYFLRDDITKFINTRGHFLFNVYRSYPILIEAKLQNMEKLYEPEADLGLISIKPPIDLILEKNYFVWPYCKFLGSEEEEEETIEFFRDKADLACGLLLMFSNAHWDETTSTRAKELLERFYTYRNSVDELNGVEHQIYVDNFKELNITINKTKGEITKGEYLFVHALSCGLRGL